MAKWYVGADRAGAALKDELIEVLKEMGAEVTDFGSNSDESVDYPEYGEKVARAVAGEKGAMGLLVCGTGIGMSMAANKIHGIRAAVVCNEFTARATREHNDANIICLGGRVIGSEVAKGCLREFMKASFEGGRHQRRVSQIAALES